MVELIISFPSDNKVSNLDINYRLVQAAIKLHMLSGEIILDLYLVSHFFWLLHDT
jgi:hypothetical protein